MYVLRHRLKHRKTRRTLVTVLAVALCLAVTAVVAARYFLRPDTHISPTPPAVTYKVTGKTKPPRHIDTPLFSIDLPSDWEPLNIPNQPYSSYNWQNTADNKGVRVVSIYVDSLPAAMAVNKVLAVQGMGANIRVLGDVSDNCVNFTSQGKPGAATQNVHGKWQGYDFICDVQNYVRNVVGISSADGTNLVKLTGTSHGPHNIFMTYTDSSAQPNYAIFIDMISSFHLK